MDRSSKREKNTSSLVLRERKFICYKNISVVFHQAHLLSRKYILKSRRTIIKCIKMISKSLLMRNNNVVIKRCRNNLSMNNLINFSDCAKRNLRPSQKRKNSIYLLPLIQCLVRSSSFFTVVDNYSCEIIISY